MKVFFDEEFTQLHKDTTLISIGLIAEDGQSFYAELDDYDQGQINDWLVDNVIANLSKDNEDLMSFADTTMKGSKLAVSTALMSWLERFDDVQFVSDVCHYDFVLLIDLLAGNALDMPRNFSPVCHDINYDIAHFFGISEIKAFDKSREEILNYFGVTIEGAKHNSIYDAKVIMVIYNLTHGLTEFDPDYYRR